jgi:hypothetical protein
MAHTTQGESMRHFTLTAVFLLAACSTSYHPIEQSPQEAAYAKAKYECELALTTSKASRSDRDELFDDCMRAHGFAKD